MPAGTAAPRPRNPGSSFREPRTGGSARRRMRSPKAAPLEHRPSRTGPQTRTSIAEARRAPAAGGSRPASVPSDGVATADGTPQPHPSTGAATRPRAAPHRCRAVDEAVSVAVARRRTEGLRRAGRTPRSLGRRTLATCSAPCPTCENVDRAEAGQGRTRLLTGRTHPVDKGVEALCPVMHRGRDPLRRTTRRRVARVTDGAAGTRRQHRAGGTDRMVDGREGKPA